MNWFSHLNIASAATGATSLATGTLVSIDLISPLAAKPIVLACFVAVFPLFFIYVIQGVLEKDEHEKDKPGRFLVRLKKSIFQTIEAIRTNLLFSFVALVLFGGGAMLWQQIEATSIRYALGDPFERVHAVGFSALVAIFMAITVLGFSSKAKRVG